MVTVTEPLRELWAGIEGFDEEHADSALAHQHALLPVQGRRRPRAVLACPPGERHDLMLLCFDLLLGEQGWRRTTSSRRSTTFDLAPADRTAN